jgi:membrane fusion protein (multidrug efflux system)
LILPVIFLVMGTLGSCSGQNGQPKQKGPAPKAKGFPVKIAQVSLEKVERTVEASGTFLPEDEVEVSAEIKGKIKEIHVEEGDRVKKDDLLVKIDDERFILAVKKAGATSNQARSNRTNTQRTFERTKDLYLKGVVGKQQYDDKETAAILAEKQLENASVDLDLAKKDLKDTKIFSSLTGLITEKIASIGEYVEEGDVLLRVEQISPIKLHVYIPERYTGEVKLGQAIQADVDAYPGRQFQGAVAVIGPGIDPETRNVRIEARFLNKDERLRPGFFAHTKIIIQTKQRALVVPQSAIIIREGYKKVFIKEGNRAKERKVETGSFFDGKVEIRKGLRGDEEIIIRGHEFLVDGNPISVVN